MTENIRRETVIDAEFEEVSENNENNENGQNVTTDNSNTVTAALILGIAGVISAFTGKFAVIGLVCSAVGLVLSSRERASNPSGTVTAAFVLSIIGAAAAAISLLLFVLALAGRLALIRFI